MYPLNFSGRPKSSIARRNSLRHLLLYDPLIGLSWFCLCLKSTIIGIYRNCNLLLACCLQDDDAFNAEAFINKASFLVSNSQHEVLNLQYKVCHCFICNNKVSDNISMKKNQIFMLATCSQVCYARILDLKRKFLEAALRYYDISQIEKRQIGDEYVCLS